MQVSGEGRRGREQYIRGWKFACETVRFCHYWTDGFGREGNRPRQDLKLGLRSQCCLGSIRLSFAQDISSSLMYIDTCLKFLIPGPFADSDHSFSPAIIRVSSHYCESMSVQRFAPSFDRRLFACLIIYNFGSIKTVLLWTLN